MRLRMRRNVSLPAELATKIDVVSAAWGDDPKHPNYSAFVEWATDTVGSWLLRNPTATRLDVEELLIRQADERDVLILRSVEERREEREYEKLRIEERKQAQARDLANRRGAYQSAEDLGRLLYAEPDDALREKARDLEHDADLVLAAAQQQREVARMERERQRESTPYEDLVEWGRAAFRAKSMRDAEAFLRELARRYRVDYARLREDSWASYKGQQDLRVVPTPQEPTSDGLKRSAPQEVARSG